MSEYVQVFGNIVLVIDVLLLLVMLWCVAFNLRSLLNHNYNTRDVAFRATMLMLCIMFSMANFEALTRHVDIFMITKVSTLNKDSVDSLLSDRGYMLGTAVGMLMLTIKYVHPWYEKD